MNTAERFGRMVIDPPRSSADITRFLSKKVEVESGCWEWTAFRMASGYGQFGARTEGRTQMVYAHRLSYTWFRGPIPAGYTVDHLCKNKCCVNPAHLEAVPNATNIQRATADLTHCKYGHEWTPENTYRNKSGRRECRPCNARRGRELRARRRAACLSI